MTTHLRDYAVLSLTELEHSYHVYAKISQPPPQCPHCGHSKLVGFGMRDGVIMDIPIRGKPVHIMLKRQRYRCQACRRVFLEPIPHRDDKRRMTRRLVRYIEQESHYRTFSSVAESVGVDEKTVRNIFHAYCDRTEAGL